MSTHSRPARLDRVPEQLISALLPDISARRPTPPPVSVAALPAPGPTGIDALAAAPARDCPCRSFRAVPGTRPSPGAGLGSGPGAGLDLDTLRGTIVIVAAVGGAHRVDHRGAIALPAAARQMCGIPTGPPVVLVADLRRQRLTVRPAAAVVRLLTDDDSGQVGTGDD